MQNPEEFVISQTFDAPRDLMWKAWTDPKLFTRWFGPKGFTAKTHVLELRPGGALHTCLKSPDGHEMWAKFVYRDIVPRSRLSWEHFFSNKEGGITRHPMHAHWPLKLLTTVVFEEQGGKTKVTLTWAPLEATDIERKAFADATESMNQGWGGTFEQLETFLSREKAAS